MYCVCIFTWKLLKMSDFVYFQRMFKPFKDEAQTALFKDPVRTAL